VSLTGEVRSVVVGGQQLRVAVRPGRVAAAGRPPLLLINGIGVSLEAFGPLLRELDPDVEVIMFDPPGIGGSARPRGPYRCTGLCRLIAGMLTELGYDQVDVLGISWGGGVAQHFAAFWQSRCRRLVLVATATGSLMVPARPSVLVHMVIPPRRQMQREHLYRVVGGVFGGSARQHPERVAEAMRDGDWLGSPLGYLYQPAVPAGDPPADTDHGRRRRPDHPAGQRQADEPAHAQVAVARLPRRASRPGHRGGRAGAGRGRLPRRTVTRPAWPSNRHSAGRLAAPAGLSAAIDHIGTKNRLRSGGDPGCAAAGVIIDTGPSGRGGLHGSPRIACSLPLPGDDQPQGIMPPDTEPVQTYPSRGPAGPGMPSGQPPAVATDLCHSPLVLVLAYIAGAAL
jgi:pimeloyl-ACP methyl ester carboxylesterase